MARSLRYRSMSLALAARTSATPISASPSRELSFIPKPPDTHLIDARLAELFELVGVRLAEALQHPKRLHRLLLVDLAEREADVNQHVLADLGALVAGEQAHVDVTADAGDLDLRDLPLGVDHLQDLAGDGQAHRSCPPGGHGRPIGETPHQRLDHVATRVDRRRDERTQ